MYKDDARAYRDKIKVLRKKTEGSKLKDSAPETPKRNAETAIYVAPLKTRFAQESSGEDDPPTATTVPNTNITKAIVHETHYEEPDEQISNGTCDNKTPPTSVANPCSSGESEISETNTDDHRLVISLNHSTESVRNESTYI